MTKITARKQHLRQDMLAQRSSQSPALGQALAAHVLASGLVPARAVVGGFMPLNGEIDVLPLLHELHQQGHQLALPETPPKGQALIFRRWTPDMKLKTGRYGTGYPDTDALVPDFLLVPLLAFDDAGNRLGYGGGYYDRTLAALPYAFRLGCAYAIQRVDDVPHEPTDLPLDAIATEIGVRRLRPARSGPND